MQERVVKLTIVNDFVRLWIVQVLSTYRICLPRFVQTVGLANMNYWTRSLIAKILCIYHYHSSSNTCLSGWLMMRWYLKAPVKLTKRPFIWITLAKVDSRISKLPFPNGRLRKIYRCRIIDWFPFNKGSRRPCSSFRGVMSQSTRAHRLVTKAGKAGGQRLQLPVLCGIFKANLEESKDIADINVLAEIAEAAGMMSKNEVRPKLLLR